MSGPESLKDMVLAFLEMGEADWDRMVANKLARDLVLVIPATVELQDELEDAKRFFLEIKELDTVTKLDEQLESVDQMRGGIVSVVTDPRVDTVEVKDIFAEVLEHIRMVLTGLTKVESITVGKIREKSKRLPRNALVKELRSYWNHIDEFWANERESVIGEWDAYFAKSNTLLSDAVALMKIPNSASGVLIKVEALLKKRSHGFMAHKVAEAKDRIHRYSVEENGLIPGHMGIRGAWKVERDDCPDLSLPEASSRISDSFAFCKSKEGKCSAFDGSTGSYVKCAAFGRIKEADLLKNIDKVTDKDFLDKIAEIASTDPFVKMLIIEANRGDGDLFMGKVTDGRLQIMLDQYPSSDRVGEYTYKVYLVANKPVFVSDGYAVCADRVLLDTIGEGARMPKISAKISKMAGPVVRIQFTTNALRDPEFREFLRKKDAEKRMHSEYDIPFKNEEEIKMLVKEIREEFGYPISVFEILEDTDIILEKDYGVYDYSKFNIVRHSSALMYMPVSPVRNASRSTEHAKSAAALRDVATNLPEGALRAKATRLADRLRVAARFLVATRADLIVYADGAIGVVPEIGSHMNVQNPVSGSHDMSELVEVKRASDGNAGETILTFRTLATGQELKVKANGVEGCGIPWDMPGMTSMGLGGARSMGPAMSHFQGDDGTVYLVKYIDMGSSPESGMSTEPHMDIQPPPPPPLLPAPFGRFPGDQPPAFMPLTVPPRVIMSPEDVGALPPMGGPANQAPQPDVVGPSVPAGPAAVVDGPMPEHDGPIMPGNPDEPAAEAVPMDDQESFVINEIQKRVKPGLKFTNLPDPTAPSGAQDEDVMDAIRKLKDKFKADPRVKDIRKDLSHQGKPILFLHTTMPKSLKEEMPSSINGFEIRVSPLHDSMYDEGEDKTATDAIVAPRGPNKLNLSEEGQVGPGPNEVSEAADPSQRNTSDPAITLFRGL